MDLTALGWGAIELPDRYKVGPKSIVSGDGFAQFSFACSASQAAALFSSMCYVRVKVEVVDCSTGNVSQSSGWSEVIGQPRGVGQGRVASTGNTVTNHGQTWPSNGKIRQMMQIIGIGGTIVCPPTEFPFHI